MLKNYMEDLVWEKIDEVLLQYPKACKCDFCRYDIAALALNSLPTRYIATRKGEIYTRINTLEQQFDVDITTALTRAIQIVSVHPRHEQHE